MVRDSIIRSPCTGRVLSTITNTVETNIEEPASKVLETMFVHPKRARFEASVMNSKGAHTCRVTLFGCSLKEGCSSFDLCWCRYGYELKKFPACNLNSLGFCRPVSNVLLDQTSTEGVIKDSQIASLDVKFCECNHAGRAFFGVFVLPSVYASPVPLPCRCGH